MRTGTYLDWLTGSTVTKWWHDSADPAELRSALGRGAVGVTTNPFLCNLAVQRNRGLWEREIGEVLRCGLPVEAKAEALARIPVTNAAAELAGEFERSGGTMGQVCAQVNPLRAGDRECMLAMAKRCNGWAPNIAVKLPATAAGLDVLEDCVAGGITCTATVSFTLPQVLAIADRHRQGAARARAAGIVPGKCFAVIMIGRLDDFLREVAHDRQAAVSESDVRQAGLAVTKRAYQLYRHRGYEAVLLVAALRGDYHLTELAGADLVMSIAPAFQQIFLSEDLPQEERIAREVPPDVVERLCTIPEFVRAYEPDGMAPPDFIAYGATQRTLSQFCEVGWRPLEALQ